VLVAVVGVFFAGTVVVRAAGHLDEAPGTGLGRRIACGKIARTRSGSKRCAADADRGERNGRAKYKPGLEQRKERAETVGGGRVRRRRAA